MVSVLCGGRGFVNVRFKKVGLSLPIDRSEDHELDIKGFARTAVGDRQDQQDLDLADVNREYDDCDMIVFLADGE